MQSSEGPRIHLKPLEWVGTGITVTTFFGKSMLRTSILTAHPHGNLSPLDYFLAYNVGNFPMGLGGPLGLDLMLRSGTGMSASERRWIAVITATIANIANETLPIFGQTRDLNDLWAGFAGIGVYALLSYLTQKMDKRD